MTKKSAAPVKATKPEPKIAKVEEPETNDRTVHAVTDQEVEIVRYDKAGKWYSESVDGRTELTVHQAVSLARTPGTEVRTGLHGGSAFDRELAQ